MDGGTIWNVNIASAVEQCKKMGFEEKDIIMDIFITEVHELPEPITHTGHTLANYIRRWDWFIYYNGLDAIKAQMRSHPDVTYRHVVEQKERLSGLDEIKFDNATTWQAQEWGRQAAKNLIECGQQCLGMANLADFV